MRYFYEERPEIAVLSAGSWLEIAFRDEAFSFPVGRVEFYHLGPMTFGEFLDATGNGLLREKLSHLSFYTAVVSKAKKALRDYLYVGGIPKAVSVFAEEKSIVPVREIQERILEGYMADFPKYNSRINTHRVRTVFQKSVLEIGKKKSINA